MQRSVIAWVVVCGVAACVLTVGTVLGNPWLVGGATCVSAGAGFTAAVLYFREP